MTRADGREIWEAVGKGDRIPSNIDRALTVDSWTGPHNIRRPQTRGWFHGESKGDGHGELSYLSYFGGSVLPTPEKVAELIALLVHGHDGLPNDAPTSRG